MTRLFKGMLAIALVGLVAVGAQAGTFSVTPSVAGYFDAGFNPIPAPAPGTNPGSPVVIQVDINMEVLSLDAGEAGFANAGFNLVLTGLTDLAGWGPDSRTVDSNGALPGGVVPLWATNVDAGTNGDLQGILVSIAGGVTGANDPRRKVGQAGGPNGYMGSVFLGWEGTTAASLDLVGLLTSANSTTGQFLQSRPGEPSTLTFGSAIPEPGTIALAGLSLVGLVLRRRAA